jgi:hypothetical protein
MMEIDVTDAEKRASLRQNILAAGGPDIDRPLAIVNRSVVSDLNPIQLPPDIVGHFGPFDRRQILVGTEEQLQAGPYALSHAELIRFRRGEPIIRVPLLLKIREPLHRGERPRDDMEKRVREALAVNVYTSTERLCALGRLQSPKGFRKTVSAARHWAWKLMAEKCWTEPVGDRVARAEPRRLENEDGAAGWFKALFDEGSRSCVAWYPGKTRPRDVGAHVRVEAEIIGAHCRTSADFDGASVRELNVVRILVRFYRRAEMLAVVQHRASIRERTGEPMTRGDHAARANSPFTLEEAGIAALHGDFDPLEIDFSHFGHETTFGQLRDVGRKMRAQPPQAGNIDYV